MSDGDACMAYQWTWRPGGEDGPLRLEYRKALMLAPSPNYRRRRERWLRMEVRWAFEELQGQPIWDRVVHAAFRAAVRRGPAWVREAGSDALVRKCRGCGVEFCVVGFRAIRHCTDACRLRHGHDADYARLGERLGLEPVAARRADRCEKRRARGIGPRQTLSIEPGTRVGYWLVIERVHAVRGDAKRFKYRCRCRCGRERDIATRLLLDGAVLSCRSCRHQREREAQSYAKCG
jgi:hypothetical protein